MMRPSHENKTHYNNACVRHDSLCDAVCQRVPSCATLSPFFLAAGSGRKDEASTVYKYLLSCLTLH